MHVFVETTANKRYSVGNRPITFQILLLYKGFTKWEKDNFLKFDLSFILLQKSIDPLEYDDKKCKHDLYLN